MNIQNKRLLLLGKVILFLVTFVVMLLLGSIIMEFIPRNQISTPLLFVIEGGFNILIVFAILALFVKVIDKEKFISSDWFSLRSRVKEFFIGGLLGSICIFFGFLIIINLNWYQVEEAPLRIVFLLSSLFGTLCGALLEEALFRGYMLRILLEKFSPLVSLTISSLIFVGFHCINPDITFLSIINIFLASILLGMLFIKTGNIWLVFGFHLFWNYIQSILGFNVSASERPGLLYLNFENANSFNGGYFGFEGSYVCSIILLLLILYFYKKSKNLEAETGKKVVSPDECKKCAKY